ncbi:type I polyketide synthase [Streptomyces pacificus]|uniref:Type I polyketide synthase n=1 Tax=Streptomyces pacificus TaxID=2705029 RepID=A0A6A0B166_9ACTN|nr:type I polyketide synthase [Streptomyces pacificus]GFH38351.1 type I polyketide synthase [Streptomyces pacificus]
MNSVERNVDLVIGITPFGEPDARLATAVSRAGGLGVLDLGRGDRRARDALAAVRRWAPGRYGVRIGPRCRIDPAELLTGHGSPGGPDTVVLAPGSSWGLSAVPPDAPLRVLVEVTGLETARRAVDSGADGLIARGSECGGPVGELSTFVLLQQLLSADGPGVPVWACGGIAPRTAAAAVVGGAAGVVLDTQLALLAESQLPEEVAAPLRTADGSQTVVSGGRRALRRRGPAGWSAADGDASAEPPGLPAGQDAGLAVLFAERWGDAGGAVRAVAGAVRDAVTGGAGTAARALRPDSPMSRALGTRLPVAQGPMTRVSDGAAFAAAVADDGALPFVALALAGAERSAAMLEQARRVLHGRPWGVGILGFAPEETRTAQLAAVRAAGPTHAIVAGGRPSQARVLEEAGVKAFLHVPSPGLLRQFLDAGARRFVFEGAECGGHVGPRNSFPLWEAQLTVLEDFLDGLAGRGEEEARAAAGRIEVFLAGGIHDRRSAAMAAALAAPLTARGCAVGTLMGTAYLFTEEAVAHGAVRPLFQRRVLAAERTSLLETAPGHATRCVPSPFSEAFGTLAAAMREEGLAEREVWERLERLNVGRLRIAAKGVERTADGGLGAVGEERQLAEGMFMAGEVAVLRSATTTLAGLHSDVCEGAARFLTGRARALASATGPGGRTQDQTGPEPPHPLDVAVVGMACMFPGAPDLASFWANVLDGVDSVGEVPRERWDPEVHGVEAGGAVTSRWGGFLPPIPFDALRYGIPPASLGSIEPVQLLALEAARRALDDAGLGDGGRDFDRTRTGVVFGAEPGSDLSHATALRAVLPAYLGGMPDGLDEQLPTLTEDSFPGMLANVISGRIANRLDLGGPNFTVDAACASSLAAVDVACKELVAGTSDVMLCGGADLHNGINDYLLFSSVHALSPTGGCRAFDGSADGITLGEGVACVVLKRLADAERDGDRVYGVVKGIGSSSDGRSLGLTAPRPEGQRRALERAHRAAGTSPADVGLVEAHGTGTVVGDRTELGVLTEVFEEAGAAPGGCVLGSVKSQIGHTKCAAGLAGLIKTVMALHTGVRPPTLHLEQPNAAWEEGRGPFVFHREALPWAAPPERRVAGLSAFGFGGTNFHVVLGAHGGGAPPSHGRDAWPAELFLFRGADAAAARRAAEWLMETASPAGDGSGGWRLRDLALAASRRAEADRGPVRIAVVAEDPEGLRLRLRRALVGEHDPGAGVHLADGDVTAPGTRGEAGGSAREGTKSTADGAPRSGCGTGRVAFLFPGQGSQRTGMFAGLFGAFPELQYLLALDRGTAAALYPPAAFTEAASGQRTAALTDTRAAQPALGMVGLAAHTLLSRAGVVPDMAAGHSYGELVALSAAGTVDPETLLTLSSERAAAILAAAGDDPGAMAAVAASPADVERILGPAGGGGEDRGGPGRNSAAGGLPDGGLPDGGVLAGGVLAGLVVANRNTPRQTVVSGPTTAVDAAVRLLREAGLGAKRLPVACAFHSPLVAAAGERFARVLTGHRLRAPEFPVWSNRTAEPYPASPEGISAELAAQISAPVRFDEQVEAMYAAGARVFVECGPGRALTGLVADILGDRPHLSVACAPRPESGLPGFLDALARLAVAGLPVATGWMFTGRDAVDPSRAGRERPAGWTVDGHLVRTASGELLPGALAPARRVAEATVTSQPGGRAAEDAASGQDALIAEFLRTSREMVAAQRDVLLTYFGAPASGDPLPAPPGAPPVSTAPVPTAPVQSPQPRDPGTTTGWVRGPLPETAGTAASGGDAGAAAPPSGSDVLHMIVDIISERTGYPAGMVEPGLDLEADLSIDSIKRTEIVGELAGRLVAAGAVPAGRGTLDDAAVEELSRARTAESLAARIRALLPGTGDEPDGGPADPGDPADVSWPPPASAPASVGHTGTGGADPAAGTPPPPAGPGERSHPSDTSHLPDASDASDPSDPSAPSRPWDAGSAGPSADAADVRGTTGTGAAAGTGNTAGTAAAAGTGDLAGAGATGAAQGPPFTAAPLVAAPKRLLARKVPLPGDPGAAAPAALRGRRFALLGDGDGALAGVAEALAAELERHGALPAVLGAEQRQPLPQEGHGPLDGVVLLDPLAVSGPPVLPAAFPSVKAALARRPARLVAVRLTEGGRAAGRSAGLRGLFRTIARECPDTEATVLDLDPGGRGGRLRTPEGAAAAVLEELGAAGCAPVVLRDADGRHGWELAEAPLGLTAVTGAGPAGDGAAEAAALGLDQDSVVLFTGGARGITAACAIALARACRCRVELLGRTPAPAGPEDPLTAAARDRSALRRALAAQGGYGSPAGVDRAAGLLLAQREISATLAALDAAGSRVRYRSADCRDSAAVLQAVKEIHADHGRLDGVVHAAGVVDDRLIAEKSAESFERVYRTKVGGATALLSALDELPGGGPSFMVLFGSVAAVLGNRGQADYAAANDALETLGEQWGTRTGRRALTVHWGPWAPDGVHTGMVQPELARAYARRGITLIDPEEGPPALLRELAWGGLTAGAVVHTASEW